jgi:hypothetical protein
MRLAPDDTYEQLRLQLAKLGDERAIRHTLSTYCEVLDYIKSGSDVARLFAPDGVLDVVMDNPVVARGKRYANGVLHRGRGQIGTFYQTLVPRHRTRVASSHHFVANTDIGWEGDEALVDSLFLIVMADPNDLGPHIMTGATKVAGYGRYVDRMVRAETGEWMFKVRQIRFEAGQTKKRQR